MSGWIAVDLDGTLAYYDHWRGIEHIGAPITPMVERVKKWIVEGKTVKIFTARVARRHDDSPKRIREVANAVGHIHVWCIEHIGVELEVTCTKDFGMIECWDDRSVQVIPNTGITIADELASERAARSGKP